MASSLPQPLLTGLRFTLPIGTTLLAGLLDLLPLPDAGPQAIAPNLALIAVYYWSVQHPQYLTPLAIMLIGIVRDLVADLPLGMTSVALLVVPLMLRNAPLPMLRRSAWVTWSSFVLAAAVVGMVRWLLGTAYWDHPLALRPFLVETGLTILAFPFVAWLLGLLEPLLAGDRRAAGE